LDDAFGLDESVDSPLIRMLGPAFARLLFAAAVAFPKAADDPDPTKWKPENCSEHLVHEPIHSSHSLRGN
jgi:hypothetical protein